MARKETLEDVLKFCKEIGIECKSTKYITSKEKMIFICTNCNEDFKKTYVELKQKKKTTCPTCSKKSNKLNTIKKENSFKELLKLCSELGLKCLSKEYKNNDTDLEFECTRCKESFFRRWKVLKKDRSTICTRCSIRDSAEKRRYSYKEVSNIFAEENCKLLSTDYIDNKQKLEYRCDCGEESTVALSNFLNGQRCKTCGIQKQADSNRTPYDEVKEIFKIEGCKLLSTTFINSSISLSYICKCGNESRIKLGAFKRGVRCRICAGNSPETYENVKNFFSLNNCELIASTYSNNNQKLEYICSCSEIATTTYYHYKKSLYHKCKKCADKLNGDRIKGKNHPQWNPELTDEDRVDRRNICGYSDWRKAVYEKDNYACQCCGTNEDLQAHHLDGYHWCEERRLDVTNGATLCISDHKLLHSIYGYRNNTEEQYEEFIENYSKKYQK